MRLLRTSDYVHHYPVHPLRLLNWIACCVRVPLINSLLNSGNLFIPGNTFFLLCTLSSDEVRMTQPPIIPFYFIHP